MKHSRMPPAIWLALGLATAAQAQSLQPGLWEIKQDIRTPGRPEVAARMARAREQMKNIPPAMRKQMEQQMAQRGVGLGDGGAVRLCISPEEAQTGPVREGKVEGQCTYTKVSHIGNTWRGTMVCKEPPSQGEFTTTLHSPERFTSQAVLTGKEGRTEMKSEGRRVSVDCGALGKKPAKPR
jgi:hypothetical protein